jgi:hypothetical protein
MRRAPCGDYRGALPRLSARAQEPGAAAAAPAETEWVLRAPVLLLLLLAAAAGGLVPIPSVRAARCRRIASSDTAPAGRDSWAASHRSWRGGAG